MFRLAEDLQCPIIQKTVSKELRAALVYCYGDIDGNISVDDVVFALTGTAAERENNPLLCQLLTIKILAMLRELEDQEYEYTFDEVGEYLLYYAIREAENKNKDYEDVGGWTTSATPNEIKEVYQEAINIASMNTDVIIQDDDVSREDGADFIGDRYYELLSEEVEDIVKRAIYAPALIREYEEDVLTPFVVWDLDFLLIDEWGFEEWNRFAGANGDRCGFTQGAKDTDPISGSFKIKIEQNIQF